MLAQNLIYVAIGGSLGALLRYLFVLFVPLPVFWVNLIGSFLIGLSYSKLSLSNHQFAPLINIGFLGAFTTFSAFSLDLLLGADLPLRTLFYAMIMVLFCFVACFGGYKLGTVFVN